MIREIGENHVHGMEIIVFTPLKAARLKVSVLECVRFLSVWQPLFYVWKYTVTRLVVVGRWAIRYRGSGCAGGDEDWFKAHLLLFDL